MSGAVEPVHAAAPATIALYSGRYYDFERPRDTPPTLADIARGLSHICRFNGQCERFYSVAEHSVLVSFLVPPEHAWDALMHDAAEAFIGDVTRPLKSLLPDYRAIEDRVEAALAEQFGLRRPMHPSIKQADRQMLRIEQRAVMRNRDRWGATEGIDVPDDVRPQLLGPSGAMAWFIDRARELGHVCPHGLPPC